MKNLKNFLSFKEEHEICVVHSTLILRLVMLYTVHVQVKSLNHCHNQINQDQKAYADGVGRVEVYVGWHGAQEVEHDLPHVRAVVHLLERPVLIEPRPTPNAVSTKHEHDSELYYDVLVQ